MKKTDDMSKLDWLSREEMMNLLSLLWFVVFHHILILDLEAIFKNKSSQPKFPFSSSYSEKKKYKISE